MPIRLRRLTMALTDRRRDASRLAYVPAFLVLALLTPHAIEDGGWYFPVLLLVCGGQMWRPTFAGWGLVTAAFAIWAVTLIAPGGGSFHERGEYSLFPRVGPHTDGCVAPVPTQAHRRRAGSDPRVVDPRWGGSGCAGLCVGMQRAVSRVQVLFRRRSRFVRRIGWCGSGAVGRCATVRDGMWGRSGALGFLNTWARWRAVAHPMHRMAFKRSRVRLPSAPLLFPAS